MLERGRHGQIPVNSELETAEVVDADPLPQNVRRRGFLSNFSGTWAAVGAGAIIAVLGVSIAVGSANRPQPLATYPGHVATKIDLAEATSQIGGQEGVDKSGMSGVVYSGPTGTMTLTRLPAYGVACTQSRNTDSAALGTCGYDRAPFVDTTDFGQMRLDSELVNRAGATPDDQVFLMFFDDRLEVWPVDPSPSPNPTSE